jgi:hypothetical protein
MGISSWLQRQIDLQNVANERQGLDPSGTPIGSAMGIYGSRTDPYGTSGYVTSGASIAPNGDPYQGTPPLGSTGSSPYAPSPAAPRPIPMPGPSMSGPAIPQSYGAPSPIPRVPVALPPSRHSAALASAQGAGGLTGGLTNAPIPPTRPADLGGSSGGGMTTPGMDQTGSDYKNNAPMYPAMDDRGYTTWQNTPLGASQSAPSGGSAPSGSNLVQGPGNPGDGLLGFLKSAFQNKPQPQGSILGQTGGKDSQPIYSGDPQSSLPSWMKGSSVANLLQMLGIGGM